MTIARVALSAIATGASGGTTTGINTTGANLLIAAVASYNTGASVTDNMGNGTYTSLTQYGSTGCYTRVWYKLSPTVGAGHTITVSGASTFSAFCLIAYSGASAFDSAVGQSTTGTVQPGSLTPAGNNELLIALASNAGTSSDVTAVDSGFTLIAHQAFGNSVNTDLGVAELIQTTAAAKNPTFTITSGISSSSATQAAFTASAGGGSTASLFRQTLLDGIGSGGPFFNNPIGRSILGWRPKLVTA